jgi:hypothetical protein
VSTLFTVTSAPTTEAPLESVTVPWIPPRNVCAMAEMERQIKRITEKAMEARVLMVRPPQNVKIAGGRIIRRGRKRNILKTRRNEKRRKDLTAVIAELAI